MTKITSILQKIVDTGVCEFIVPTHDGGVHPCSLCPLSRLKKRPDGQGWLSCFEAVCGPDFYDGDIKLKYKNAAQSKLVELAVEEMLEDAEKKVDN